MRKSIFMIAIVAAVGLTAGSANAKGRWQTVSRDTIVRLCGGDLHPAGCNWCNAIRCYVVEGCTATKCSVYSFREVPGGSTDPKSAITQNSGLLENTMAGGSPGGPSPVGTPVVVPGRAR